jgi:hypothetical protein
MKLISTTVAAALLVSQTSAVTLQPPSLMVQLFSQQKNIVGMAEVLSKKYEDKHPSNSGI